MARYTATIHSPLPLEQTFDYMADFSNAAEWDANTVSSECVDGDPGRMGARYEVVTEFGGRELKLAYETTEYKPHERVVLVSGTGMAAIEDVMTFREIPEGTEIKYQATVKPKGLAKIFDPVFGLVFRRVGDRAADSMRKTLQSK
jgi:hypothetical protein